MLGVDWKTAIAADIQSLATDEIEDVNEDMRTAMHLAAKTGNLCLVYALIKAGACISPRDDQSYTPLLLAVEYGNESVMQALISANASVEDKGHLDWRPMHYAAGKGHINAIKLLVQNGADLNSQNAFKRTPM